jgi:hypothetical protein
MKCENCGGARLRPAVYKARDDDGKRWIGLPAIECLTCGTLRPDADKIASMPDLEVPSSIRLRSAKTRAAG